MRGSRGEGNTITDNLVLLIRDDMDAYLVVET